MAKFIVLEREFLRRIATDSERIPTLYYHSFGPLRAVFWQRLKTLYRMIERQTIGRRRCLDFGGGGGVFLPSLTQLFEQVDCIDLEVSEAQLVVGEYQLKNINLLQGDVGEVDLSGLDYDLIVAADVLEHFVDLSMPVAALKNWLGPDGLLVTSLPSENWLYVFLRKLFAIEKPADHYHTAEEVEAFLEIQGFRRCQRRFVPLNWAPVALFHISCWRLK